MTSFSLSRNLCIPIRVPIPICGNRKATHTRRFKWKDLNCVPLRKISVSTLHPIRSGEMSGIESKGGGGEENVSIELLSKKLQDFNTERGWLPHHSPRNLLLALVGEMGELSEIFQWKGEVERGVPGWKEEEKLHLGEELSDVLLYLIQLSDSCGVDLGGAALRKLHLNSLKYPPPPPSDPNNSN